MGAGVEAEWYSMKYVRNCVSRFNNLYFIDRAEFFSAIVTLLSLNLKSRC
jgi:hypothetical protein